MLIVGPSPALLRIKGNAEGRHFAVEGTETSGAETSLFVNTTEPYEGTVPLNFTVNEGTSRLHITATGHWTIEVLPLSSARVINAPGITSGTGDDVLAVSGTPDIAQISGNKNSRHFAVIAYGSFVDLLVNTTNPYNGRVDVSPDVTFLEINAEGLWTISFP